MGQHMSNSQLLWAAQAFLSYSHLQKEVDSRKRPLAVPFCMTSPAVPGQPPHSISLQGAWERMGVWPVAGSDSLDQALIRSLEPGLLPAPFFGG
jgi:hypothetical protein